MRRRRLLAAAASAAATATTAGCLGGSGDATASPTAFSNPPEGVYVPTRVSEAAVIGTADAGPFRVGLLYSRPTRFWELVGETGYERGVASDDDVHLMALAWDPETGVVFPEAGLTVRIARSGTLVTQESVYAMLSQRLGFHYGDNVPLPGADTYEVTVTVGGLQLRRTGAFAGRFDSAASHTFEWLYDPADRQALATERPAAAGETGTVAPVERRGIPTTAGQAVPSLGREFGRQTVDDAVIVPQLVTGNAAERLLAGLDSPESGSAGSDTQPRQYLAVSVLTRHLRFRLPSMGLRVVFDSETDGVASVQTTLSRTVDPELGYHYGAAVPPALTETSDEGASGVTVAVETLTPPQVARHEGYETAFRAFDTVRFSIDVD